MSIDTDRFRSLLLEERERVQNAIDNVHHDGPLQDEIEEMGGSSDNHIGDTATATLDREIDYTLEDNSGRMLAQIDAALARADAGTYGTCTRCGRPIAEERLEATPWASLCIDCQRESERQ